MQPVVPATTVVGVGETRPIRAAQLRTNTCNEERIRRRRRRTEETEEEKKTADLFVGGLSDGDEFDVVVEEAHQTQEYDPAVQAHHHATRKTRSKGLEKERWREYTHGRVRKCAEKETAMNRFGKTTKIQHRKRTNTGT